jgi:hypothetical protein
MFSHKGEGFVALVQELRVWVVVLGAHPLRPLPPPWARVRCLEGRPMLGPLSKGAPTWRPLMALAMQGVTVYGSCGDGKLTCDAARHIQGGATPHIHK